MLCCGYKMRQALHARRMHDEMHYILYVMTHYDIIMMMMNECVHEWRGKTAKQIATASEKSKRTSLNEDKIEMSRERSLSMHKGYVPDLLPNSLKPLIPTPLPDFPLSRFRWVIIILRSSYIMYPWLFQILTEASFSHQVWRTLQRWGGTTMGSDWKEGSEE